MLNRLWTYAKTLLVADVPNEMAACLDCGHLACPAARFRDCPNRLAQAKVLDRIDDAARHPQAGSAPVKH